MSIQGHIFMMHLTDHTFLRFLVDRHLNKPVAAVILVILNSYWARQSPHCAKGFICVNSLSSYNQPCGGGLVFSIQQQRKLRRRELHEQDSVKPHRCVQGFQAALKRRGRGKACAVGGTPLGKKLTASQIQSCYAVNYFIYWASAKDFLEEQGFVQLEEQASENKQKHRCFTVLQKGELRFQAC